MNPIIAMVAVVHENEIRLDEFALLLAAVATLILALKDFVVNRRARDRHAAPELRDASALGIGSSPSA